MTEKTLARFVFTEGAEMSDSQTQAAPQTVPTVRVEIPKPLYDFAVKLLELATGEPAPRDWIEAMIAADADRRLQGEACRITGPSLAEILSLAGQARDGHYRDFLRRLAEGDADAYGEAEIAFKLTIAEAPR